MSKYKPYNLKDVNEASSQNKFNVISTFAGGGGSSTGYRLAGGKILCINEFVEEAQNTYKENYPDTPILPGDIKKLTAKDLTGQFQLGELIVGTARSTGETVAYRLNSVNYDDDDAYEDNQEIETEADAILDFTEQNPFGEV